MEVLCVCVCVSYMQKRFILLLLLWLLSHIMSPNIRLRTMSFAICVLFSFHLKYGIGFKNNMEDNLVEQQIQIWWQMNAACMCAYTLVHFVFPTNNLCSTVLNKGIRFLAIKWKHFFKAALAKECDRETITLNGLNEWIQSLSTEH